MYERILIIGNCGSGKSYLSRKLQQQWQLPIVHLDQLFWLPHWVQKDNEQFRAQLQQELEKEQWIIDGNYTATLEQRLAYADCIIFLDYSLAICLFNVLTRYVKNKGKTRADMTENCEEKIDLAFLQHVWRFPKRSRRKIVNALQQTTKDSIVFKNRRQLKNWLGHLEEKE